ncbi:MAG: type II secretion system F family protein [Anaerolinea sp.]|nr:type II secretion system F family protein [Anaerolinea sp.]
MNEQIPEFLRVMEVALRSGYSVAQGLEIVTKDMDGPLTAAVQRVLNDLQAGTSLLSALDQWLARAPSRDLDLIIATIRVQLEVGGNLADRFQFISQLLPKLQIA